MKHLVTIQSDFLKIAAAWDKLTLQQQKLYLKKHPKSKKKITALELNDNKSKDQEKSQLSNVIHQISNVGYDDEVTDLERDIGELYKIQPFDVSDVKDDGFKIKFHNNIKDLQKNEQDKIREMIAGMNDPQTSNYENDKLQLENEKDFLDNNTVHFWWDDVVASIADKDEDFGENITPHDQNSKAKALIMDAEWWLKNFSISYNDEKSIKDWKVTKDQSKLAIMKLNTFKDQLQDLMKQSNDDASMTEDKQAIKKSLTEVNDFIKKIESIPDSSFAEKRKDF